MRNTRLTYKRRETQVNGGEEKRMGGKRNKQTMENRNTMGCEIGCVIVGDKHDGMMIGAKGQGSNPFMQRPRTSPPPSQVYTGFGILNEISYI